MKIQGNPLSQRGMVLVITVIMLSVITLMAVAYIAFARRERVSVVMSVTRTEAQFALDHALAEAGRSIEEQLQQFRVPGVVVSTGNSNQPPTGYYNSAQLTSLANGDLPPVTYDHDNNGIADEFRYWLDLNRDGRFQATATNQTGDPLWVGQLQSTNSIHNKTNRFVSRHAFMALPAGLTVDLNTAHSRNYIRGDVLTGAWDLNLAGTLHALNPVLWNYLYVPSGGSVGAAFRDAQSLWDYRYRQDRHRDLLEVYRLQNNPIYINFASRMYRAGNRSFYQLAGSAGIVPRTGPVGRINLNQLRLFMTNSLSTSLSGTIPNTIIDIDTIRNEITLQRPHGLYTGAQVEFGDAAPPFGPFKPTVSIDEVAGYLPPQEFYAEVVDNRRIRLYARRADRDDPDPHLANPPQDALVHFLQRAVNITTGTALSGLPRGSNAYVIYSDSVLNTFEQLADRFLRDSGRTKALRGLSRLKVFGASGSYPWDYDAETHRLLQVAANISDTYSPGIFPSIFRPVLARHVDNNGDAFIVINRFYRERNANFLSTTNTLELLNTNSIPTAIAVTPYGRVLRRRANSAAIVGQSLSQDEGFPLVIGVKNRVSGTVAGTAVQQIFPNLNEVALEIFVKETFDPATGGVRRILMGRVTWEVWNSTQMNLDVDIRLQGEVRIQYSNGVGGLVLRRLPINVSTIRSAIGSSPSGRMIVGNDRTLIPIDLPHIVPTGSPPIQINAEVRLEFQMKSTTNDKLIDHASLVLRAKNPIDVSFDLSSEPRNRGVWVASRTYRPGDIVRHRNLWWLSRANFTSGSRFNPSAWTVLNEKRVEVNWQVNDPLVNDLGGHYTVKSDMRAVQPWGPSLNYVPGQLVKVGADYQFCLRGHRSGTTFTQPNWRQINQGLNIAYQNSAYQPWRVADYSDIQNVARKDPGVTSAYAWKFPNQSNPSEPALGVGQLGRIHRGTPWQTLYLKSLNYTARSNIASKRMMANGPPPAPGLAPPTAPIYQTLRSHTFRTGDAAILTGSTAFGFAGPITFYIRLLNSSGEFSLHLTPFSANQPFPIHNPQDINLAPLAAGGWLILEGRDAWRRWAGYPETRATNDWRLLDHFTSLTNYPGASLGLLSVNQSHHAAWAAAMSGMKINTAAGIHYAHPTDGKMTNIVNAINDHRVRNHQARPFERVSDILGVPLLTDRSPYLGGITPTDRDFEAIPEQILPLLRASPDEDPYAMLYGFAQTLRPADNSIALGSGVATNYVITGEQAGRVTAWIANRPRERWQTNRWYRPGDVVWTGGTSVYRCTYNQGLKRHLSSLAPSSNGIFWEEVPADIGLNSVWSSSNQYFPGQRVRHMGREFLCLRRHRHETIPPERLPWLWQEVYKGPVRLWGSPAGLVATVRTISVASGGTTRIYSTTAPHPFATGDVVRLTGLPAAGLGPLAGPNMVVRMDYGTQEFSLRFASTGAPVPPVPIGGLVTVTLVSRSIHYVKGEHVMSLGRIFRCIANHDASDLRSPANSRALWVPESVRLQMDSFEPFPVRRPK